ncbi:transposable element Tcb2 transposase [Trichonephila clavipes]|nr:transposable element Tcb2 transposase [Trichonephila clavipes]
MGLQFLFMDDNAPRHRTVAAEQLLESEDIERMDWPARSPDLNPIEHVWDFLGRRLAARTLPPITIRELRLALQDEWAAMPQQLIDTLILSMGRRCETCLAVREIIPPTKDRMFLAGHPSQGCFGLQSHCPPCYFFNQGSFYPSDFSFKSGGYTENDGFPVLPVRFSKHLQDSRPFNLKRENAKLFKFARGSLYPKLRVANVALYERIMRFHQCLFIYWALGAGSQGLGGSQKGLDKLDLTRFSGYKFPSSSAKEACRSSAPRARIELK